MTSYWVTCNAARHVPVRLHRGGDFFTSSPIMTRRSLLVKFLTHSWGPVATITYVDHVLDRSIVFIKVAARKIPMSVLASIIFPEFAQAKAVEKGYQ